MVPSTNQSVANVICSIVQKNKKVVENIVDLSIAKKALQTQAQESPKFEDIFDSNWDHFI